MSLQVAVAVPFRQRGTDRLGEGEFVVALSLDRDWFSPDQAKRLVDLARGRGLLEIDPETDDLVPGFDLDAVEIPENFTPDESVLREQSTFERALETIVSNGVDKQTAVASINERQRDLGISIEAAAVVYARERGTEVDGLADAVRREIVESATDRADGNVPDGETDAGGPV